MFMTTRITALSVAIALSLGSAHATENRITEATKLLTGFSQLNNTPAGQRVLRENLETSIAINNRATDAERARAVSDNTIAALVGSMTNGMLIADALGTRMSAIFNAHNSLNAQTYSATVFSDHFGELLSQVNALIQADSSFAKNFYANGSANGNPLMPATGIQLPDGGVYNVYDLAYQPSEEDRNTVGNSRPVQVALDRIETFSAPDYFGVDTDTAVAIIPTLKGNAAFPSGHSAFGFASTLLLAEMVPERFQEFVLRGSEYGNSRIILGAHYALDVIGARIMTTYAVAQILNNNPDYLQQNIQSMLGAPVTTSGDFQSLMQSASTDLRNLLEQGCGSSIAECVAAERASQLQEKRQNKADYLFRMTYGLSPTGATDLAPVVPEGAEVLIASRFPYLSAEQRRDVLATTEIESGHALDNGSGWARINLYAAADGYGAFNGDVSVTMDAAQGGVSAYDSWGNDISGQGTFVKKGTGTLELTGNNSFSGTTTVAGGQLIVNGDHRHSSVTVETGALLSGSGKTGTLTVKSGGAVAPGNSIGTLDVAGDVNFQPDAQYAVEIAADGRSDRIQSAGTATLDGGDVTVSPEGRGNLLTQREVHSLQGKQFTILTAEQGVHGQFNRVQPGWLFLGTTLNYQPDRVLLNVGRNGTAFADIALTDNQRTVAMAADRLSAGNPVYESILLSTSKDEARQAYRQLAGQIHADVASALLNDSRYLRESMNERLRQREGISRSTDIQANEGGAWVQLLGGWGRASGDDNATGWQSSTRGVLLGVDSALVNDIQLGGVVGYTRTTVDGGDHASGTSDNTHLGIYASKQEGSLSLRLGGGYTWHSIDTERGVSYGAQSDYLRAGYHARTAQLFAETGYRIRTDVVNLEPFANLAYTHFQRDSLREKGGAAALHGEKQSTNATISTLGLRTDVQIDAVKLQGELGWQHQYGERNRDAGLMFSDPNAAFVVNSVPVSRDGAIVKAGAEVSLGKQATLALSYGGLLSDNHQDHRVNANLSWQF